MDALDLRSAAVLVKNGIPLDVAMAMEPHERLAWGIAFGEAEGGEWDWDSGAWKEP